MWDVNISLEKVDAIILEFIKKHSEEVKINEEDFLDLLKHSLSLNTQEKKRVVDASPTLSQFQFDELSKVFTEERIKFKDLATKNAEDIKKLLIKQQSEWLELGDLYMSEILNTKLEKQAKQKEKEIKKSLGL